MNLLPAALVILLLVSLNIHEIIGDCSVYNVIQSSRCHQVQDCINAAFFSDRKNLYVLDKIFRSTELQSPVALIVNYHVTVLQDNHINTNHNSDGSVSGEENFSISGSGSVSGSGETEVYNTNKSNWTTTDPTVDNPKPTGEISYTEQLGWSTTGIYRATRPVLLIALQPAWYWWTLGFAIDNHSFPITIHLHLNIASTSECDCLKDILRAEVKEALQHFTMNLNYNTTGKAVYLWNTNANPLRPVEKLLLIIIISLAISTLVLLTGILPKLHHYGSKLNWDSGGLGILIGFLMLIEAFFHFFFMVRFNNALYTRIRGILTYAIPSIAAFGGIYGALTSCCYGNSCTRIGTNAVNFAFIYMSGTCFAIYTLPVLIEASIYPTEIISTIGFVVIGMAGISAGYSISKWIIGRGSKKSTSMLKNMRTKCCNFLQMAIISAGICIVVPFTIYTFLMLYLILLKLRVETPGSQLFQILLAIVSTVSAGLGSFVIKQKLRLKEKANSLVDNTELNSDSSDDETEFVGKGKQEKGGDYNEQIDQTMYTHEQRQPRRRQQRKQQRMENQRQKRQQNSSQEMQVLIEVNTDVGTDNESTM